MPFAVPDVWGVPWAAACELRPPRSVLDTIAFLADVVRRPAPTLAANNFKQSLWQHMGAAD